MCDYKCLFYYLDSVLLAHTKHFVCGGAYNALALAAIKIQCVAAPDAKEDQGSRSIEYMETSALGSEYLFYFYLNLRVKSRVCIFQTIGCKRRAKNQKHKKIFFQNRILYIPQEQDSGDMVQRQYRMRARMPHHIDSHNALLQCQLQCPNTFASHSIPSHQPVIFPIYQGQLFSKSLP